MHTKKIPVNLIFHLPENIMLMKKIRDSVFHFASYSAAITLKE